ncbi:DUF6079 family protein [Paenibacillus sp. BIC5C1]|uniref:DUF6079 family protein n=1 Tax=Paenibacillus sp. BIC5C1 TaxID=3078263 RepID=UPI0028E3DB3C|nr:DUF6079 family protein [Paenibacillus sp. BIC5C1]
MIKYSDLVQFEPIESVIQLIDANDSDRAFHLLDTYVISDRMAEQLNELIINQLQFERAADNKGLLIVGNYGTGKSHLMSVISTIAEYEGASNHIQNNSVAEKAREVQGKFKVIRLEIGSVGTSLRDILCNSIEDGLQSMGVEYTFPQFNQITNNKDALEEMMGLFNEKYPNQGLLVIVDELLDYLRGRREQELTLDLGFLREIGEVCSKTRLRFIAGIQEMLFNNPRFSYVSEPLQRVKERFEQVRIIREDIAHVVSQRLLKKSDEQKAIIRKHLSKFTTLYHRLSEDMETFVDLFPIHPSYLTAFEKVNNIEKRVALKTISIEMNRIINNELSEEEPGLISYDSYWRFIEEDPSYKAIPEVAEVLDKAKILKDRVQNAYTKRIYKPMALRIVNALAVYRLSTADIYHNVGLTAEELRDDLFLDLSGNNNMLLEEEDPADFLKSTIDVATKEIQKTVSFQYISTNDSNGQYYLDLKKDIDIDSLITQRAETIEEDKLDRYYFHILQKVITLDDNTYVSGYKIWRHDLPWDSHRVRRHGYLFFGAPNERSTAQPERDFYIYMLRPYLKTTFKDEHRADEIFFELNRADGRFEQLLKLYAAADDLKTDATSATKSLYQRKLDSYFKELSKWLNESFVHSFDITYKGKKQTVLEFGLFLPTNETIREIMDIVSEGLLTDWFEEKYEGYPVFRDIKDGYLSKANMETYVKDALQCFVGRETRQGLAILNGLVLLDNMNKVTTKNSGYAKWINSLLDSKGHGQVLNYQELIETKIVNKVPDIQYTNKFKLEPELLIVLMGAMISTGDIEVTIENKIYNASNLHEYVQLPLTKLTYFSNVKKPTDIPYQELNALLDLLNISLPNYEEENLKHAIVKLAEKVNDHINDIFLVMQYVKEGFPMWDGTLLTNAERQEYLTSLNLFKEFCETIKRYNTPAKMRNYKSSVEVIQRQEEALKQLDYFKDLHQSLEESKVLASYIQLAQSTIGLQSDWSNRATHALDELSYALKGQKNHTAELQSLVALKHEYIKLYMEKHDFSRLNATENNMKKQLLASSELKALKELGRYISILPMEQIQSWERSLGSLKECYAVTSETLQHSPLCNNCKYRLSELKMSEKAMLKTLEAQLPDIYESWIDTVLTSLNDASVKENIELLQPEQKGIVKEFIATKQLSVPLDIRLAQAINDLLKGFNKVEISMADLEQMMANGSPLTVEELRNRFEQLLKQTVGMGPTNQIRITLTKE